MAGIPTITFSNGLKMPMLGLGTFKSEVGKVKNAVKDAIDFGYRHFDTAFVYDDEDEVGEGVRDKIKDGTVTRDDIFITTKLWNDAHREDLVVPACKRSLANLGLDYVDLFLIHSPMSFKEGTGTTVQDFLTGNCVDANIDYLETWRGMEECVHQGLARSIGVSNFNSEQITRLLKSAKIAPVNNQVEVNINFNQDKLIDFCKKHNITVTGYSPLGRPRGLAGVDSKVDNKLDNSIILQLAKKYNKTPAQIALRFVSQQGAVPIPRSLNNGRIKQNMEIFDFTLTSDEMIDIRKLGTGQRLPGFEILPITAIPLKNGLTVIGQFHNIDVITSALKDFKHYPFDIPF